MNRSNRKNKRTREENVEIFDRQDTIVITSRLSSVYGRAKPTSENIVVTPHPRVAAKLQKQDAKELKKIGFKRVYKGKPLRG